MLKWRFLPFVTIFFVMLFVLSLQEVRGNQARASDRSGNAESLPGVSFVHRATISNIANDRTLINNALLNGQPNAIVLVTQNWNPGGANGVYNPTDVGIYYDLTAQRWGILNEDASPMPIGAAFNLFVVDQSAAAFVHSSVYNNTYLYWTSLDHPLANNTPRAMLFATHLYASPGHTGEHHPHSLGVRYNNNQWAILNEDNVTMNLDVDFNVLIGPTHPNVYTHIATPANTGGPASFLDHPALNNNPYAIITVSQNWNPGGVGGVNNNHPISVWYDIPAQKWCVFNEDIANIPLGSAYNVMIQASTVYLPIIRR